MHIQVGTSPLAPACTVMHACSCSAPSRSTPSQRWDGHDNTPRHQRAACNRPCTRGNKPAMSCFDVGSRGNPGLRRFAEAGPACLPPAAATPGRHALSGAPRHGEAPQPSSPGWVLRIALAIVIQVPARCSACTNKAPQGGALSWRRRPQGSRRTGPGNQGHPRRLRKLVRRSRRRRPWPTARA